MLRVYTSSMCSPATGYDCLPTRPPIAGFVWTIQYLVNLAYLYHDVTIIVDFTGVYHAADSSPQQYTN